jgi:hypothetical protein
VSVNKTTYAFTIIESTGYTFSNHLSTHEGRFSSNVINTGFYKGLTNVFTPSVYPIMNDGGANDAFQFKHNIVLNESLIATNFKAQAYDIDSGFRVSEVTLTGTGGDILLPRGKQYLISVSPDMGSVFKTVETYVLNQLVFPLNSTAFPFYFKCTSAGVSGVVEPAWNTTIGGVTSTGSAQFTMVEQIPNASAKFPILAVPV